MFAVFVQFISLLVLVQTINLKELQILLFTDARFVVEILIFVGSFYYRAARGCFV